MSNQCFITRRGGGSFNKSVMFVTAPSGSTVTMQNMVRSDNLVTDVQYQEAATKDLSCVTIKQCGEVSKGDRIRVSLEVTTSEDAVGYWASESGLITDKREVNLKSGKQTITLDITASGNLNLDTKFFCKGDESEATITAANLQLYKYTAGTTLKTATEKNGVWRFNGLDIGLWLIKAEKESETPATQEFEIKEFDVYRVTLAFRMTPEFTYTGDYEIVDDDDNPIDDFANWKDNWKIRFLTSGTFTITNMYGWDGRIDIFRVGAGAGGGYSGSGSTNQIAGTGGGGGYTNTTKGFKVEPFVPYEIVIGSGGNPGGQDQGNASPGGTTTAFDGEALGGIGGSGRYGTRKGGDGASGGGGDTGPNSYPGGTDGSDGEGNAPGIGQGSTTREFGEEGNKLYSSGGPSGNPVSGEQNSGDGGGGAVYKGTECAAGCSGIVIIRNAREVA